MLDTPPMRRLAFVFAALVTVAPARPASAQDAAATAADALFQGGRDAMDRGELDVACERFRASFKLQSAVGTLINLGTCEERRGHHSVALQCFRDSLALLGAGDFRRPYVEERLAALKARVAFARIVVNGAPPGSVSIVQDAVELGPASVGIELTVDPGPHVFEARAPGFTTQRVVVQLAPGERRDVVLRLVPASGQPPTVPAKPEPSARPAGARSGPGPFVLMGGGAAAMATGAVFGLVVMGAASDVKAHCDATGCDETGLAAARNGRPFALLSPILLAAGAALVGGGVLWWRLSRDRTVALAPLSIAGTF